MRKYFSKDLRVAAQEIVNGIRKEFEIQLENIKWIDNVTRLSVRNKLKAIYTHIGYPDEIMDNAKIENYYKNLNIDENSYLSSILNIKVFQTDCAFNQLHKPVNKTDWITHANLAIVSASYSPYENSIGKHFTKAIEDIFFNQLSDLQNFQQAFSKGTSSQQTVKYSISFDFFILEINVLFI